MSLYTCIKDEKGELIVLNKKYTKEQLREKLLLTNCCKSWLDHILDTGIYLDQPCVKKVCAKKDRAYLTTQEQGHRVIFKAIQTIVVYPDGYWREAKVVERITKQVDDGMWGNVLYTKITYKDGYVKIILNKSYEREEIKERLLQMEYSENLAERISQIGYYLNSPIEIKLSAAIDDEAMIEQCLEGIGEKIREIHRSRTITIYANGYWKFGRIRKII